MAWTEGGGRGPGGLVLAQCPVTACGGLWWFHAQDYWVARLYRRWSTLVDMAAVG